MYKLLHLPTGNVLTHDDVGTFSDDIRALRLDIQTVRRQSGWSFGGSPKQEKLRRQHLALEAVLKSRLDATREVALFGTKTAAIRGLKYFLSRQENVKRVEFDIVRTKRK